jgi:hypothetical protein
MADLHDAAVVNRQRHYPFGDAPKSNPHHQIRVHSLQAQALTGVEGSVDRSMANLERPQYGLSLSLVARATELPCHRTNG